METQNVRYNYENENYNYLFVFVFKNPSKKNIASKQ